MARLMALAAWMTILAGSFAPAWADDDPIVRDRKLSDWLIDLRGEKDLRTRSLTTLCIGAPATHPVLWLTQTKNRRAALLAAEVAGPTKNRQVLPTIVDVLRTDPEDSLRAAAAASLGRQAANPKNDPDLFGPAAAALLLTLSEDQGPRVREAAAEALGRMTMVPGLAKDAIPALTKALTDPAQGARRGAAEGLRRWGREALPALEALRKTLGDAENSAVTRSLAARAIGAIGYPDAVAALPTLRAILADDKCPTDVRIVAVETIGNLGPDVASVVPLLGEVLTTADAPAALRQEVAAALGKFGPAARPALPALKKAAVDSDKFVRCQALFAFSRIGKDLGDEVDAVTKLLLTAQTESIPEVRLAAIETLGKLGPDVLGANADEVRKRLGESSRDPVKEVREAAEAALTRLRPAPNP